MQPYVQISYPTTVGTVVSADVCIAAPFADNGSVWQGTLTKPGGYQANIAWDSHGDIAPSTYTVPTGQGYASSQDIHGHVNNIGTTVTLTNEPLNIQNVGWTALLF